MIRVRDRDGQVHQVESHFAAAQRWRGMHLVPAVSDSSLILVLDADELAAWSQVVASMGRAHAAAQAMQRRWREIIQAGGKARAESVARGGPWSASTGSTLDRLSELLGQVTNLPAQGMAAWRSEVDQNVRMLGGLARDGFRAGYKEWGAAVAELSTAYAEAFKKAADAAAEAAKKAADAAAEVAKKAGEGLGDFWEELLGLKPGLLLLLGGGALLAFYAFTPGGLALIGVGGQAVAGVAGAGKAIGVAGINAVPGAFQAAAAFVPGNAAASAAAAAAA